MGWKIASCGKLCVLYAHLVTYFVVKESVNQVTQFYTIKLCRGAALDVENQDTGDISQRLPSKWGDALPWSQCACCENSCCDNGATQCLSVLPIRSCGAHLSHKDPTELDSSDSLLPADHCLDEYKQENWIS